MAANDILAKVSVIINAQTAQLGKDLKQTQNQLSSFTSGVTKLAGTLGVAFGIQQVAAFGVEISRLAGEATGVKAAFDRLADSEKLMRSIKEATGDTVSELNLMKRTVQASNFGIALEQLPRLLEFATLRAQQTGQSVDYLVDSIVTGIGRKSPLILDNLGISAIRLREKFKGIGVESVSVATVTKAVGEIAEEELSKMAGFSQNASTAMQQLSAEWTNFKVVLGDAANGTGVTGTAIKLLTDLITNLKDAIKGVSDGPASLEEALGLSFDSNSKKELNATIVAYKALNDFALKYYDGDVKRAQEEFINNQYKEILNLQIQKAALDELKAVSGSEFKESNDQLNLEIKVRRDIIAAIKAQSAAQNSLDTETAKSSGIVEKLEERIKSLGESIKTATSISSIRKFQEQLERAKNQLNDILKPPPAPEVIPITFKLEQDWESVFKNIEIPPVIVDIEIGGESTAAADQMIDNLKRIRQEAEYLRVELNNIIESSIEQGIYGLADAFGQLARSANGVTAFKNALLSTFGDLLQNLGKIAIQTGLGVEAIKEALKSLNGYVAVAAGVALVALGAAVKAGVRSIGSGGGGSISLPSSSTGSSFRTPQSLSQSAQNSQLIPNFKIQGQDLWVIFNAYQTNNKYTSSIGG